MGLNRRLALVLSGGGARGAYEVGIIHYIRTMLPAPVRHRRFPIQCGSSVGAINTCFMASTANDLEYQGKQIVSLWRELKTENIYSRNLSALSHFLAKSTLKAHSMTLLEKFLMKALDIEPALSLDLMSYLTFEKSYLEQLIEIGFQDAKKYHAQLLGFLEEPS